MLSESQLAAYHRDGYFLSKALFDAEETELLRAGARTDPSISGRAVERADGEGGKSRITLWNQAGDDLLSMFSRCERVVSVAEQVLDDEAYFWHSKMMQKEPFVGGAWAWHQDYGYWYNDSCLFPLLLSCYIAVDRATRENGCLQVLKGSQALGRMEHMRVGDQTGADPVRCEQAEKHFDLVYCEMEPGDALFFHSNLLHRSDQNKSSDPRWALITCYNAKRNTPFGKSGHPSYSPLKRVPDTAIKESGLKFMAANIDYLK